MFWICAPPLSLCACANAVQGACATGGAVAVSHRGGSSGPLEPHLQTRSGVCQSHHIRKSSRSMWNRKKHSELLRAAWERYVDGAFSRSGPARAQIVDAAFSVSLRHRANHSLHFGLVGKSIRSAASSWLSPELVEGAWYEYFLHNQARPPIGMDAASPRQRAHLHGQARLTILAAIPTPATDRCT